MTLDEIDRLRAQAEEVREAQAHLQDMRKKLKTFNAKAKGVTTFGVQFVIDPGDTYGDGKVTMAVNLPVGVFQQALVYQVAAAERDLVRAENAIRG